jgi:nucleoid DNA-binding protein
MESVSEEAFAQAFVEVLQSALSQSGEVSVPGLGTFAVRHIPSEFREHTGGDISLTPPRDVVTFEPGPLLSARRNG